MPKKIEKTTKDHLNEKCPVRNVLSRLGDKWSLLAIAALGEKKVLRFNELAASLGDISQKMLTVTLRTLEADGLVERTIYPEIPPRVEYRLTLMGASLLPHIESLAQWAELHMGAIKESRERYADRELRAS
jgi:DNA-binding HxlR family transcriptional regulator